MTPGQQALIEQPEHPLLPLDGPNGVVTNGKTPVSWPKIRRQKGFIFYRSMVDYKPDEQPGG